jgi:DNA-binding NarL/FixJ family response regulator
MTIRVFLADDHPPLRVGLRVLLEQCADIQVIGESGDGHDALAQIEMLCPDLAVIDCQLPGLEGIKVTAEIKRRGLPTRVLALSSFADEWYVRGMLDADAVGYLLKEEAPERIIEAVRAAARGEGMFSVRVAQQIAKLAQASSNAKPSGALTERERQIVERIVHGQTNKAIGQELGISDKAVEKHISAIFAKWHVKSRAEIAARAVRED